MANSAQSNEINFQPIPKRFMVWDKRKEKWIDYIDAFPDDVSEMSAGEVTYDSFYYRNCS